MWININAKEPTNFEKVLIYPYDKTSPTIECATYDKYKQAFFNDLEGYEIDVDYWAELPKSPLQEFLELRFYKDLAGK